MATHHRQSWGKMLSSSMARKQEAASIRNEDETCIMSLATKAELKRSNKYIACLLLKNNRTKTPTK